MLVTQPVDYVELSSTGRWCTNAYSSASVRDVTLTDVLYGSVKLNGQGKWMMAGSENKNHFLREAAASSWEYDVVAISSNVSRKRRCVTAGGWDMKLLLTQCRRARCSRAHLLFVALLLAVYLSTLVFFHFELDDMYPRRVAAPHETHDHVATSEKTLVDVRRQRVVVDRRQRVRYGSTHVSKSSPTTVHPLERCADVQAVSPANDSTVEDQTFDSWPRIFNRRPINLVAPTLPWCSEQHDAELVTPHHAALNVSSSFQLVAGQHYVYSAYYDDREPSSPSGLVRVIAILKTGSATPPTPTLFCHVDASPSDWSFASMVMMMWSSRYHTAPLEYYEMCENHGKDYGGWILTCPLPRGLRRPPCHIFLSSSETMDPWTAVSLPVFSTRPAASPDSVPVRFVYVCMCIFVKF